MRETEIVGQLRAGSVELPPLTLRLVGIEPIAVRETAFSQPDAYVEIEWGDRSQLFAAEILARATPKTFRGALEQIRLVATSREMLPLIVMPYLTPDRLRLLEEIGVSGVDLSGNGVVVVAGRWAVVRSGSPNRYPASRKIRNVYRGTSSLVARAFLLRTSYTQVQDVLQEVAERGAGVAISTVSKVLRVLEDDLIIGREGSRSWLLQADELLERLATNFRAPRVTARKRYRWAGSTEELQDRLGKQRGGLVATGAASGDRYSVMPRESALQCYCTEIKQVEQAIGSGLEESDRFPDLELLETDDPTVYFDIRATDSIAYASPVQAWLELQAGDKRQREAAEVVRRVIMDEVRRIEVARQ